MLPAPSNSAPARKISLDANVKDTIESILVAFMLAFIFRAYVVEAFVIPTGSMAPTLLGAHMRFRCPDCGYRFDVNFQGVDTGDDVHIESSAGPNRVFAIICPNCGYRLPRLNPQDPANDATDPAVRYGDRILVLKYLYLLQDPSRWDVVVFKAPADPRRYDYSQNYIKRLVGKPDETIMILDGDVYVSTSPYDGDPQAYLHTFKVQTKPRKVQDALWRIVYDNDYYPRGLDRSDLADYNGKPFSDPPFVQPWKQESGQNGWTLGDGSPGHRDFSFNSPEGAAALRFDASVDSRKYPLTDWLAYDITDNQQDRGGNPDMYRAGGYRTEPANNVSDVKLDFYYQRASGSGPLRIQLSKIDHRFEAAILPDKAALLMDGKVIAGPVALPQVHGPLHVQMMNVDYQVTLRIQDQDLLQTTHQQYHPDLDKLMDAYRQNDPMPKPTIRLVGEKQACTLSHLSLWRDIYYLNRERPGQAPLRWATPRNFPKGLITLGKDEFFVLGDNSYVSSDARYWEDEIDLPSEGLEVQAGRVPRRFLLGKAFFVYWPAGYRPISSAPALAPNFGDMRFIH